MSLPDSLRGKRPTWVEVDLNRLESNFLALRKLLPRSVKIMAVIKADAYGHGAVPVALRLQQLGVDALAVAILEEALVLRKAGVNCPLVLLNGFWPGQEEEILYHRLTPVIFRPEIKLEKAATVERPVVYHLATPASRAWGGIRGGRAKIQIQSPDGVKGFITSAWQRIFKMVQPKRNKRPRGFRRCGVVWPRGAMPPTALAFEFPTELDGWRRPTGGLRRKSPARPAKPAGIGSCAELQDSGDAGANGSARLFHWIWKFLHRQSG
jgi:hypothetical protein